MPDEEMRTVSIILAYVWLSPLSTVRKERGKERGSIREIPREYDIIRGSIRQTDTHTVRQDKQTTETERQR